MWCTLAVFVLGLCAGAVHGATLESTMVNGSAILGNTATFTCTVSGVQGIGEAMAMAKDAVAISSDLVVLNTTKYAMAGTYVLTINDAVFSDEGTYTCTMGASQTTAYMIVSDPPTNASIYWTATDDDGDDVDKNSWTPADKLANLTCESLTSRPPATFRWFKGTTELTSSATTETATVDANGYGTAMSKLPLTPTATDEGVVYQCLVDIPGGTAYYTKELAVSFSGAKETMASLAVILMSIMAAINM